MTAVRLLPLLAFAAAAAVSVPASAQVWHRSGATKRGWHQVTPGDRHLPRPRRRAQEASEPAAPTPSPGAKIINAGDALKPSETPKPRAVPPPPVIDRRRP